MLRDLDDALREIYELKNTISHLVKEIVQLKYGVKLHDWVKTKDGIVQVTEVTLTHMRGRKGGGPATEYAYEDVDLT